MPTKLKEIPALSRSDILRFWSKVDKSPGFGPNGECWEWKGSTAGANNYGNFHIIDQDYRAHRVAYIIQNGRIPDGYNVLHRCDYSSCVRHGHLWLGTHRDNMTDMCRKGRHVAPRGIKNGAHTKPECVLKGSKNGQSKLTEPQVLEIRAKYIPFEYSYSMLGAEYGVELQTIHKIINRISWKHI